MPITSILGGILGAGSSLAGAALGGPTTSGKSTTTPNFDPSQISGLRQLWKQYSDALALGPNVSQSDKNANALNVNQAYSTIDPAIEGSLVSRGFGSSGKVGEGLRETATARVGQQQQGLQALNQQAIQRYLTLIGMGQGVIGSPLGGTTTTQSGTVNPGFGPSVAGIGGDLSSLLMYKNLFPGIFSGGGSSGGGGDWSGLAAGGAYGT